MTFLSEQLWRGATEQPYPAPGNVAALTTAAAVLHGRRDAASHAHDQLHSVGSSNAGWEGEAADTFRSTIGKLLPNLQKATDSFGQAGDAIARFRSDLAQLQARADALRPQLQHAEAALRSAQAGRFSFDPAAHAEWVRAHNAVVPLVNQAAGIADEYRSAAHICAARIDAASHAGIRNSWRTFLAAHQKGLDQISDWSEKIAEWSGNAQLVALAAAAILTATGVGAPVAVGLVAAAGIFKATNMAATVVRIASDVGLASAQQTTSGRLSTEKKWDLGEGALSAVLLVPALSPGKQVGKRIFDPSIVEQQQASRAALASKNYPAFEQAFRNESTYQGLKELTEKIVDDKVENAFSSVRDVVDPSQRKRSTPCP